MLGGVNGMCLLNKKCTFSTEPLSLTVEGAFFDQCKCFEQRATRADFPADDQLQVRERNGLTPMRPY